MKKKKLLPSHKKENWERIFLQAWTQECFLYKKKNHGEDSRDNPVSVINQFTQEKGDTSAREALASNHQIAT